MSLLYDRNAVVRISNHSVERMIEYSGRGRHHAVKAIVAMYRSGVEIGGQRSGEFLVENYCKDVENTMY